MLLIVSRGSWRGWIDHIEEWRSVEGKSKGSRCQRWNEMKEGPGDCCVTLENHDLSSDSHFNLVHFGAGHGFS